MRKQTAFTLIELIIVVTIIALLISIAVPTLAYARSIAKKTVCLTHARELSHSMSLYIQDWNALVPYTWVTSDPNAPVTANVWSIPLGPYGNTNKVRQCPEAVGGGLNKPVGSFVLPWTQYYLDVKGSYSLTQSGGFAINSWVSGTSTSIVNANDEDSDTTDSDDTGKVFGTVVQTTVEYSYNLKWAREGVNVPTFADGIWSETAPLPSDKPGDLKLGSTDQANQMARICIIRHRKAVSVAFFDGHAETVSLRDLWTLNWKPSWIPPSILPNIR